VNARATIKGDVTRLSGIGTAIIVGILLLAYRSPTALLLGLLRCCRARWPGWRR